VDGDIDDVLCCKLQAKCSSLYTTGMCAFNALADNQDTIDCTNDLYVDGTADDARCCKFKVNAVAFTQLRCVYLMHWQTGKVQSIAPASFVQRRDQVANMGQGCHMGKRERYTSRLP